MDRYLAERERETYIYIEGEREIDREIGISVGR